jgi:hypothetical protein
LANRFLHIAWKLDGVDLPKPGRSSSALFTSLMRGCVGSGAAQSLAGFLKSLSLPDPDAVLDARAAVQVDKLQDDEMFVLFTSLATALNRRCQQGQNGVIDSTMIVLSLVQQAMAAGRVDAIYAPVRQLARGQVLQHALSAANRLRRLPELRAQIKRVQSVWLQADGSCKY